jgi:hypothetical protein
MIFAVATIANMALRAASNAPRRRSRRQSEPQPFAAATARRSASVNTLALVEYAVVPILPWRVGEFLSGVCLGDALNLFTIVIETPDSHSFTDSPSIFIGLSMPWTSYVVDLSKATRERRECW